MTSSPGDILSVVDDGDYSLAVPTPDHFIPLLYVAGLGDAAQQSARVLVDGYAMGSLSMTCSLSAATRSRPAEPERHHPYRTYRRTSPTCDLLCP